MLRLPRRLSVVALICVAVGGCGASRRPSGAEGKAAKTLTRAFHALGTGDGATLCSLATPAGQKTLASAVPNSSCAKVVKIVSAHLTGQQKAALASLQIKRITVNGDRATVRDSDLSSARGSLKGFLNPRSPPTQLARQTDGSWKISG